MASYSDAESVLRRILDALAEADVSYMLTGSFASAFHGAPRATHDIDIVIAPSLGSLEKLLKQLPSDRYYSSREAALQAFGSEGLFNVIDFESGWKVDFIIKKRRPFSSCEFERRREESLMGTTVFVASAEDVVISKLEWAKLAESERQLEDVAGVLRTRKGQLDLDYIERWLTTLGLESQWERVQALVV
jgi:hypothetical protein